LDWTFLAFVLSVIGTATGVGSLVYGILRDRKQKADVRLSTDVGFFLELGKETIVTLRIFADNVGLKDTSIKRIVATVPAEGGGVTLADGRLQDGKVLPLDIGAGKSDVLNVTFNFASARPRFTTRDKSQMLPSALASGFTGRSLYVRVVIEHTHGKAFTHYVTYSATAAETFLFGSLSQMRLNAELLRKTK